jgi:hypothetical protein
MRTLEERRAALKRRGALPELDRRREATQATLDKFIGKPFSWSEGRHCVALAHYHLRQLGWRPPQLPTLPRIRSALAAKKELQRRGFLTVSDMLDSFLVRIPPAMMRLGDIAVTPGDEGFDAILIRTAPRKLLGWLPDGSAVVNYDAGLEDLTGAWRV